MLQLFDEVTLEPCGGGGGGEAEVGWGITLCLNYIKLLHQVVY